MNLKGVTAIVTGGGRGLGQAFACGLAESGANVVVADIGDTTDTVGRIEAAGGRALGLQVDITDQEAVGEMANRTVSAFGSIDALVNNAAYFRAARSGTFESIDPSELDRCLEVNVKGTWLATRAVLPVMKKAGRGKIVNVSSASVWKGKSATGPHYLTSKAATIGFTRALARELGQYGITVNTLVPDAIPETGGLDDPRGADARRQVDPRCIQRVQTAQDMVGTLLYLCAGGSDFVTGQSLHVNGGSYFT